MHHRGRRTIQVSGTSFRANAAGRPRPTVTIPCSVSKAGTNAVFCRIEMSLGSPNSSPFIWLTRSRPPCNRNGMRDAIHEVTTRRYIENNPTKARLVRDPKAWPWSSARFRDKHGRLEF